MARRRMKDYLRDAVIFGTAATVGIFSGNAIHKDAPKFIDGQVKLEKFSATTGEKISEWNGHNMILNSGGTEMLKLMTGESSNHLSTAYAQIGIGDNSVATTAGMTGLQAVTNTAFKTVDTGYPTAASANTVSWRSTFDSTSGNFAWKEIVLKQSGSGVVFSRLINSTSGWGTKDNTMVWTLTYTYVVGN